MKMNAEKVKPYIYTMLFFALPLFLFWLFGRPSLKNSAGSKPDRPKPAFAIMVHGGAGNFTSADLGSRNEIMIKAAMLSVVEMGVNELKKGSKAVDVAEMVVALLEDDSLFNAGKGAVLNVNGEAELDAAIMDGRNLKAGAIAAAQKIKNPVKAARLVMDSSKHVLIAGPGADIFARRFNLPMVENSYFVTQDALNRWKKKQKENPQNKPHGTVGCVVLDNEGNLAAATSTGGMSGKMQGRVGDSPLIGCGTYASNQSCAVSCTGSGEFFIRTGVAGLVSSLIEFSHYSLRQASDTAMGRIIKLGGQGGIIAIDLAGNMVCVFNTTGMIRAYADEHTPPEVELFKKDVH